MNKGLFISFLVCVISITISASAAVSERDWKAPGDGLLTYDDVNRREWLDLSVSRLDQFPEPRLDNAIAEIGQGGVFDGFTWAKREDVRALAESAGIDASKSDLAINQASTSELIELLGPTFQTSGILRSIGLIDEIQTVHQSVPPYDGTAFLVNINPATGGGYAGLFFNLPDDLLRPSSNGLALYRVVPEPVTAALLVGTTFLLLTSRIAVRKS